MFHGIFWMGQYPRLTVTMEAFKAVMSLCLNMQSHESLRRSLCTLLQHEFIRVELRSFLYWKERDMRNLVSLVIITIPF